MRRASIRVGYGRDTLEHTTDPLLEYKLHGNSGCVDTRGSRARFTDQWRCEFHMNARVRLYPAHAPGPYPKCFGYGAEQCGVNGLDAATVARQIFRLCNIKTRGPSDRDDVDCAAASTLPMK